MAPRPRVAVFALAMLAAAPAAYAQNPMAAVRADRWADADTAAAGYADPVARDLVTYFRTIAPGGAHLGEIVRFIAAKPDWPNQPLLERRREEALAREADNTLVLTECDRMAVHAPEALLRCGDAYSADGRPDQAAAAIREAWRSGINDAAAEQGFLARFGAIVTQQDQRDRFDHLAWTDTNAAGRQAARLDPAARRTAEARLALRRNDPAAPILLAALPQDARTGSALMLEFARWLRRAGQDQNALAVWKAQGEAAQHAAPPDHLAEFWAERNVLARRLLAAGDAAGAYALAAMPGQTAAEPMADSAFLAGFIALRRLNDPTTALAHFRALAGIGHAAISQARAHYWAGRALEAGGKSEGDGGGGSAGAAAAEYRQAAAFPLTFYGQLATLALGTDPAALAATIRGLKDPGWTREQVLAFTDGDQVRAAAMLEAWGEPRRAAAFLLRLDEQAPDPAERSIGARLALNLGLPDVAVAIARRMGRDGLALPDAGWPLPVDPPSGAIDPAVTLGLIRQESSFDLGATSPTGARGLMQLMPATADMMARRIGEQTSVIALTTDAAHNMRLGTTYLQDVLSRFGGAMPLAFAAYNAGPNRVAEWLATNGDPRAGQIDMLDWIELIPFGETRNYVQRVLENVVIYSAKRGQKVPRLLAQEAG